MVSYTKKGRVADSIGVEWKTYFVNKKDTEALAIGDVLVLDEANKYYEKGGASATGPDFAVVAKAAAAANATNPTVEVWKDKGTRVSLEAGGAIPAHSYVQLDADNNVVTWTMAAGLDPNEVVGQYNQHSASKATGTTTADIADAQTALPDAADGEIIYIDLNVRPASVVNT